jgi:hypothetical protein
MDHERLVVQLRWQKSMEEADEPSEEVGSARDLILLHDCRGNVRDKGGFTPAERLDCQRLLVQVEDRSQLLHRRALKVIGEFIAVTVNALPAG